MKITKNTRLTNVRSGSTSDSTLGILYADNTPIGFVIEDEYREIKLKGETRIPQGTYRLGLRKQETPLTLKYQKDHDWFKWHIELLNVPNFSGIYIHIGNTEKHTDGCQIVNVDASIAKGEFKGKYSTPLFKDLYLQLCPLLEAGHAIYYQIIDNDVF